MHCELQVPPKVEMGGMTWTVCTPGNLSAFVRAYHARRPGLTRQQAVQRACKLLMRGINSGTGWLGEQAGGLTSNAVQIAGNLAAGVPARHGLHYYEHAGLFTR